LRLENFIERTERRDPEGMSFSKSLVTSIMLREVPKSVIEAVVAASLNSEEIEERSLLFLFGSGKADPPCR